MSSDVTDVTVNTVTAHDCTYRIFNPGGLIGRPLAEGRPYERHLLDWIFDAGFTGTAVDVGAHVGNHTLWLAAVCGLRVHAFEPNHTEALRVNVALNDLDDQVIVHDCALGAEPTTAQWSGKDRLSTGAGPVPVLPLDGFHLEDVSVIKVDVEDMEPEVLRGAEATIRDQRPVLFLEARDLACHNAIADVIEPWGYAHSGTAKTATPVERWVPQ